MMNQNTTQPHTTAQQKHLFTNAARGLYESQAEVAHLNFRWICPGCGTAHAVTLPEECESCGGTSLEFKYSSGLDI